MLYDDLVPSNTYLAHHGVKGMKWGVRRFQNPDGSLTGAGRRRYEKDADRLGKAFKKWSEANYDHYKNVSYKMLVDKNGKPLTGNKIEVYNVKKAQKSAKKARIVESIYEELNKKYDEVKIDNSSRVKNGKGYISISLKKDGKTLISEIPIEFNELVGENIEYVRAYKD